MKGFNFSKLGYIYGAMINENPNSDDIKALSKLSVLVDELLDKNLVLKNFISSICNNIERLYLKYHNLTITLAKIFKVLFMNSIDSENYTTLNQFGLLSDLEILFENPVPLVAEDFDKIDLKVESLWKNKNLDFFRNFDKIEDKMNFLQEYLLSPLNNNEVKNKYQTIALRSKEFGNLKINKFQEIKQSYNKLKQIIEKNKNMPLSLLEEHMKSYTAIFQNVFNATYNEVKDMLSFIFNAFEDSGNEKQISFSQLSNKKFGNTSTSNMKTTIPNELNTSKTGNLSYINSFTNDDSSFINNKSNTTEKRVHFFGQDFQTPKLENKLLDIINYQIEGLEKKTVSHKRSISYGHEKDRVL